MYIPLVREAVEVEGRRGMYLVVRVDYARQVADLILRAGNGDTEPEVPFSLIYELGRAPQVVLRRQVPSAGC